MTSGPSVRRLGDVVRVHHGFAFKGESFTDPRPSLPVVVKPGMFRESGGFDMSYDRIQGYDGEVPDGYYLSPGDVVVVMTCQTQGGEILGVPARVPDDGRLYLHNQRIGKVEFLDGIDPDYGYWLLNDWSVRRQLVQTATGSTVLHTSPDRIADCRVRLPDLATQKRLAQTLDLFAARLDSNRRIRSAIDDLCGALIQSWFVDFDPVEACADGRISPGIPALSADAWPASFIDDWTGLPEGWEWAQLGDLAQLVKKPVKPANQPSAAYQHFSIPSFDSDEVAVIELGESILSGKTSLSDDTVLVSKLNPHRWWRVWLASPSADYEAICSTEFVPLVPTADIPVTLLFALLRWDQRLRKEILSKCSGTTTSRQRFRPGDLLACAVAVPPFGLRDQLATVVRALIDVRQAAAVDGSSTSEVLRLLLPSAIAGRLSVQ